MSSVRVFVGTRKGAFVLDSDARTKNWQVNGPFFPGLEIFHVKASPVNPNRVYASQASEWFGQVIQRSDDGGKTWEPVGNKFLYDGDPGTHQFYDGSLVPWKFKKVWALEPSLTEAETVYAGVEDAALFRSTDGGMNWEELPGLREVKGNLWGPGAGGLCLHTIIQNPKIHSNSLLLSRLPVHSGRMTAARPGYPSIRVSIPIMNYRILMRM